MRAASFLERVLHAKDEAFLLSFDVDVNLLQDYTTTLANWRVP